MVIIVTPVFIQASPMLRKRQVTPKTIILDVLRLTRGGYCQSAKLIAVGELFDFKASTTQCATTMPVVTKFVTQFMGETTLFNVSQLQDKSMHYYGGTYNVLQQTQVLNHWAFMPFQWFCFNFGHTHSIHHFVPNQPFYIRQIISKQVNALLKNKGVKCNDLASILAANQYRECEDPVKST